MSAMRWLSWSPTPPTGRAMPPRRSRSSGMRCRMWSGPPRRWSKGAPLVWPRKIRGNLAFETELGDAEATARAFAEAARTVSLTLVNQRLVANYLDTRGVVAEYDPGDDRITLTLSSQGSHSVRDVLCADVLEIEPEQDAGGDARRRRRLRHQALSLPRIRARRRSRRGVSGVRSNGSRTAASISSATRRAATTSPPRSSRSTATAVSSRSTSTSSPTWAPISPATRRSFRSSAPACRPASTTFRPATCACAAPSPIRCRSMPIAAPGGPRRPM